MRTVLHRADTRGYFDFGWLKTHHSFSFGKWYDPSRMNFGKLRVLNDDQIAPGTGFGKHPHENMEIVSIALKGALAHKDSAGHEQVITPGEVQVMSAGTGISHSEYNHSQTSSAHFLQVWVLPDRAGHRPRYDQNVFPAEGQQNHFQILVSPEKNGQALWLNQDAYFSRAELEPGTRVPYRTHNPVNGVYFFVIEGEVKVAKEVISRRDGLGVWETEAVDVFAQKPSQVLAIEVPIS